MYVSSSVTITSTSGFPAELILNCPREGMTKSVSSRSADEDVNTCANVGTLPSLAPPTPNHGGPWSIGLPVADAAVTLY